MVILAAGAESMMMITKRMIMVKINLSDQVRVRGLTVIRMTQYAGGFYPVAVFFGDFFICYISVFLCLCFCGLSSIRICINWQRVSTLFNPASQPGGWEWRLRKADH